MKKVAGAAGAASAAPLTFRKLLRPVLGCVSYALEELLGVSDAGGVVKSVVDPC